MAISSGCALTARKPELNNLLDYGSQASVSRMDHLR
jgi:hypothetical protein